MKPPITGMTTRPYGLPLMLDAWLSFIAWTIEQEDLVAAFLDETGLDILSLSRRSSLDAVIDKATGFESEILAQWADFVTKNLWGEEE